jgi:TolB-like protein/tetratricopeptide (TPR) repeat protein
MQGTRTSVSEENKSHRSLPSRLDSWKEIASFFGRQVRTVQLWEKREGLPVRRQHHKKLGSVFALRSELEAWQSGRSAIGPGNVRLAAEDGSLILRTAIDASNAESGGSGMRILALPFETLHHGIEHAAGAQPAERFGRGLQHDLILELTRSKRQPVVVPLQSIPYHASSPLAWASEMAAELEIDAILTGSIRHSGSQLRVSVQFIRASDMLCLWSERFEAEMGGSFDLQAELAMKICEALPDHRVRSERPGRSGSTANSGLAFHACSLGFHAWSQRSAGGLRDAIDYFNDAIELDPGYADAYAGLADTYLSLSYCHLIPARTAASLASKAARTARRLNKDSIRVNNAYINSLLHCDRNLDLAERHCRQMIDAGRQDARTLQLYSTIMILRDRNEDSIRWALHARELGDERDQIPLTGQISLAHFYSGDYENAISTIDTAIEKQPRYTMGYVLLGRAEVQRGNWQHAISAFTKGMELSNGALFAKALLASAYAGGGDKARSYAILNKLGTERSEDAFPAYDVSAAYAALNKGDEAMTYLRSALKNRDIMSIYIGQDPRFSGLRGSLEFQRVSSLVCGGHALPDSI